MAELSPGQIERDLGRLQQADPGIKPLAAAANPDAIRDKTAVARNTPPSSGGGISSPLTEEAISTRTYWDGSVMTSSDGLLVWPAVKTITMTDAAGRSVEFVFAEPA